MPRYYSGQWDCQRWINGFVCGAASTRRYTNGWYCVDHTPAKIMGREEPKPAWYLADLVPVAMQEYRLISPKELWQQNRRDRIDGERSARRAHKK